MKTVRLFAARKSDSESDDDVTNMINESMKDKKKRKSDGDTKKSAEKPTDSDDSDDSVSKENAVRRFRTRRTFFLFIW